jgi:SOS-response transcriptional repressor LexA
LDRPSPAALSAIAELADDAERSTWLEAAGIAQFAQQLPEDVRVVPVLKDAAAAGTPRAIDPANVERTIALPSAWLPPGGKLYAIPVVGDSMSPTITEGNLVLIDISQKSAKNLIDWMVAAKDAEGGVTIKYLRHDGDLFFLVPEHTSVRHPIKIMRSEGDWSIVGKVVKIIADPPSPRRK